MKPNNMKLQRVCMCMCVHACVCMCACMRLCVFAHARVHVDVLYGYNGCVSLPLIASNDSCGVAMAM